ncbi:MAG: hypothetical protein J07HN6_00047 [Halonotius sp. J07HN6]|jgi:hypothetical protein|nr:MAG: hypothetical protein J07HN6_00047 [Halonotius sp. J07HN6]
MLASQWVLLVVLAGFAAHALVLYAAHRRIQAAADTTDADTPNSVTVADGTVECPDCGTPNNADYRYCGGCAQQLPHAGPLNQQDGGLRRSLFG